MFGLMIAVAMSMLLPNVSEAAAKKPAAVKAKTVKVYKSTSNTKTATVKVKWKKALLMYVVLVIQAIVIITSQNILLAIIGALVIIILNGKNIAWAKSKGMSLLRGS